MCTCTYMWTPRDTQTPQTEALSLPCKQAVRKDQTENQEETVLLSFPLIETLEGEILNPEDSGRKKEN